MAALKSAVALIQANQVIGLILNVVTLGQSRLGSLSVVLNPSRRCYTEFRVPADVCMRLAEAREAKPETSKQMVLFKDCFRKLFMNRN